MRSKINRMLRVVHSRLQMHLKINQQKQNYHMLKLCQQLQRIMLVLKVITYLTLDISKNANTMPTAHFARIPKKKKVDKVRFHPEKTYLSILYTLNISSYLQVFQCRKRFPQRNPQQRYVLLENKYSVTYSCVRHKNNNKYFYFYFNR